ncbi:MAG TPA: phage tail protein [Pseudomonadales bacterium]|nr:phage tail protein [Pseudomonadales bacterium]
MGKTVKGLLIAAVVIGISFLIPPAGIAIGTATITSGAILAAGVTMALSTVAMAAFGPKIPKTQASRLNVSLDPSTPRKAVFGTTAMPLDLRYHESSGTNQEYVDYIVAVASHKIASVTEIWFEEKQAWTLAGGVTSTYSGYLTVQIRTEGTDANYISINGGSKWGSSRRLTGCAYIYLRIKRTGNTKKAESPLVGGLPSRVTVIGEGALLYDPRKDSTVPGGSGSHRATNQSTWGAYTDADDCDNPVLQLLWWLIGWEINNKLSVGCGVPYTRIDMESFITAANICDETVTLATGGTQKRYRTSGTASDSDDRMDIINNLLASMNGTLRDNAGKLSVTVMINDLADYVLDFDENDMLGEFDWQQTRGLTENYNIARGRFVDPSANSLYQMVDYPEVGFTSPDGIERVMSLDLSYVEDGRRAQRIAKQILQRNQYRGMFSTTFNTKALGCQVGDVVRLSLEALGWSNKLFRVVSQEIRFDGQVPLALIEENPAIYAWDRDDSAPVTPTAPTIYNPLNSPFILGIDVAGTTADWSGVIDDNGDKPEDNADVTANAVPSLDQVAPVAFAADFLGVLSAGQLPKNIAVIRRRGGVDVSSSTTWSIVSQTGISGVTVTVSSSGIVTIPTGAIIGTSSTIEVRSVRDGTTLDARIGVTRNDAAPPSTGSSGGTTVSDSTFNPVSGTSFVAISDLMTVKTGSSGQVQFAAALTTTVEAAPSVGTFPVEMKWQYRTVGGTFADVASAVPSTTDAATLFEGFYYSEDGFIDCSPLKTGLSASTDYEVQLFARRISSTPLKDVFFIGTASAVGS